LNFEARAPIDGVACHDRCSERSVLLAVSGGRHRSRRNRELVARSVPPAAGWASFLAIRVPGRTAPKVMIISTIVRYPSRASDIWAAAGAECRGVLADVADVHDQDGAAGFEDAADLGDRGGAPGR